MGAARDQAHPAITTPRKAEAAGSTPTARFTRPPLARTIGASGSGAAGRYDTQDVLAGGMWLGNNGMSPVLGASAQMEALLPGTGRCGPLRHPSHPASAGLACRPAGACRRQLMKRLQCKGPRRHRLLLLCCRIMPRHFGWPSSPKLLMGDNVRPGGWLAWQLRAKAIA